MNMMRDIQWSLVKGRLIILNSMVLKKMIAQTRGSQYSVVKGCTDQMIRQYDNVLNVRIRMPISSELHPRNFITKILHYPKIISIPNSMTVLPELLPMMIDMARHQRTGAINLTNPGVISHGEILEMYKELVDPHFHYQIMDLFELKKYTVGGRSNNCLNTELIRSLYPEVRPIKEAIRSILEELRSK